MSSHESLQHIAEQLRRMHEGDAWHGPSVREALEGVTAEMAIRHAVREAHTIYDIAHHVAAWAGEVTRRLEGRAPQMPDEGDFPAPVVALSESGWASARARVDDAHARLTAAILAFDPARLQEPLGSQLNAPLGTGVTFAGMLHGLIQHDAYHAGQIVLLKRTMAAGAPPATGG